jgi:hypothetical protein
MATLFLPFLPQASVDKWPLASAAEIMPMTQLNTLNGAWSEQQEQQEQQQHGVRRSARPKRGPQLQLADDVAEDEPESPRPHKRGARAKRGGDDDSDASPCDDCSDEGAAPQHQRRNSKLLTENQRQSNRMAQKRFRDKQKVGRPIPAAVQSRASNRARIWILHAAPHLTPLLSPCPSSAEAHAGPGGHGGAPQRATGRGAAAERAAAARRRRQAAGRRRRRWGGPPPHPDPP